MTADATSTVQIGGSRAQAFDVLPNRDCRAPGPLWSTSGAAQVAVGRKRSADHVPSMETCRTGWMPWEARA
jgi:hypothetical protein